jgi:glycosyltransferase involved in cell wall biosynthesis
VLVGDGPEKQNLELRIKNQGLENAVHFRGALAHDEAVKEIAKAEVFVCPSLAEGLGIVFIESQAAGVPVIGTDVGGIPDVIEDGVTGLLVPPKDSQAIVMAIAKIFNNHELHDRLMSQAKERLSRFDWDHIADQISKVYRSI